MKKNLIKAIFVVAIVMVSGINMFSSQKSETLSEVALANVEALAADTDESCESSEKASAVASSADFILNISP